MRARNGAGPAAAGTAIEARKIAGKCESFSQTTSSPQVRSWKDAATETLEAIKAKFPRFAGADAPLRVGIHRDVCAALPELSEKDVGRALKFHTSKTRYLRCCTEGSRRIGLNGEPAGTVSATEAAHAAQCLAQRRRGKQLPPQPQKKLTLENLKVAAAARKRAAMAADEGGAS
jgi:sRNA-binding protein